MGFDAERARRASNPIEPVSKDEISRSHRAKSTQKSPEAVTRLAPRRYKVTQEGGTDPAFDEEFCDKKDAGTYVEIVSGDPDNIQLEFIAMGQRRSRP